MTPWAPTGFTLLELLVVMAILALGWFSFLPSLNLADEDAAKGPYHELNLLVEEARRKAVADYRTQVLELTLGGADVRWEGRSAPLPEELSACTVNGRRYRGLVYPFRVYKTGTMDYVQMTMLSGERVASKPLTTTFEVRDD